MQRNNQDHPRKNAERDASQAIAGQPRTNDDDDELEQPENVPSFLTAKELQARGPAKVREQPKRDPFEAEEADKKQGK